MNILNDIKTRYMTFVLGSGRSGTSLFCQQLINNGAYTSPTTVTANYANPYGGFEDLAIRDIIINLYKDFNQEMYYPLPKNWIDDARAKKTVILFKNRILDLLDINTKNILFLKEPRMSTIIPLILRTCNPNRIVPRFVHCIRNPSNVIESMQRNYGEDPSYSEIGWLYRTLRVLADTSFDCYLLHYESWSQSNSEILSKAIEYALFYDLNNNQTKLNFNNSYISNLNRSINNEFQLNNPLVIDLYASLKVFNGVAANYPELVKNTNKILNIANSYNSVFQKISKYRSQIQKLNDRSKTFDDASTTICQLKDELKLLDRKLLETQQSNQLLTSSIKRLLHLYQDKD